MYLRMLKRDLKHKAGLNIILCLFILIAMILMSTGVVLMAGAFTNEERSYEITKSPDLFCTMPTPMDEGVYEIVENRIREIEGFQYFERSEAYRLNGTSVKFGDGKSEFMDNEGKRDFYLYTMPEENNRPIDYDNEIFDVENGQIAISQTFERKHNIKIGDKIRITTQLGNIYEFTVAKFFKLPVAEHVECLIISDEDYAALSDEFPVKTTIYNVYCPPEEEDYVSGLSRVGNLFINDLIHYDVQATPGKALFLTNDGILTVIVSVVFEVAAVFTLAMIFVTINFSLNSEIKREEREIGMMKAIGVNSLSYKTLFVVKYIFFAILGGIIAIPMTAVLSSAVMNEIYYHLVLPSEAFVVLLSVITGIALLLVIIGFSLLSLRKINKISIMDAIHGNNRGERFKKSGFFLHGKKMPIPFFLAFSDILRGLKRYAGLIISFILGIAVLVLVVQSRDTILTDSYTHRYFQTGKINFYCRYDDAYLEKLVQQTGSIEGALALVNDNFKEHGIPANIEIYGNEHATVVKDGQDIAAYMKWHESSNEEVLIIPGGNAPILKNEVAITAYRAKSEGINIGDKISIRFEKYGPDHVTLSEVCEDFIVTGFIDNYGSGAMTVLLGDEFDKKYLRNEQLDLYSYYIDCKDSEYDEYFKQMDDLYKDDEVIFYDIDNTADQMIPGFKAIFDMMLVIVSVLIFVVLALLTFLYERMFIEEEQSDIAMMKCVGFKTSSCRAWHLIRLLILSAAAVIIGHILIVAIGTPIFAEVFKNAMRTVTFKLAIDYMHNFVIIPCAVMAALALLIYISTHGMNLIKIWRIRNE